MSDVLSDQDIDRIIVLGQQITAGLRCDADGTGLPCRTDRFAAIRDMVEYLHIHDIEIAR